jgi:hypothetical protein
LVKYEFRSSHCRRKPSEDEQEQIVAYFEKYYDLFYINYIKDIFVYQKKVSSMTMIYINEKELLDTGSKKLARN